jgi:hypothetical protein
MYTGRIRNIGGSHEIRGLRTPGFVDVGNVPEPTGNISACPVT